MLKQLKMAEESIRFVTRIVIIILALLTLFIVLGWVASKASGASETLSDLLGSIFGG